MQPLKTVHVFSPSRKRAEELHQNCRLEVAKQTSDFLKKNIAELKTTTRFYLRISGRATT